MAWKKLPGAASAEPLNREDAHDVLVGRAAKALWVADLDALSGYFYLHKEAALAAIGRLQAAGLLEPVTVAGLDAPHWLWHAARRPRQLHAQFVLEILDVFGDTGLGCKKCPGHRGQVEILAHGFANDPELLKIHGPTPCGKPAPLNALWWLLPPSAAA